jgi:hypothetical protein
MRHRYYRPLLVLMLCGLIAGCATSPERQAQLDSDRCTARGYQPTSKGHDDCLNQVQSSRELRTQRQHQDLVERRVTVPGR